MCAAKIFCALVAWNQSLLSVVYVVAHILTNEKNRAITTKNTRNWQAVSRDGSLEAWGPKHSRDKKSTREADYKIVSQDEARG